MSLEKLIPAIHQFRQIWKLVDPALDEPTPALYALCSAAGCHVNLAFERSPVAGALLSLR